MPEWEELANRPLPRYDKEIPSSDWVLEKNSPAATPDTDIQAVMETLPYDTVPDSKETPTLEGRVMNIVETELSAEERDVIEATIFAGHSVRKSAEILGLPKSTVHRLQKSALDRIRKLLEMENGK